MVHRLAFGRLILGSLVLLSARLGDAAPSFAPQTPFSSHTDPSSSSSSAQGSTPSYDVTHEVTYLTMKDGTNLSVTYTIPEAKYHGETFPVLFDYRPYRKDDSMYTHDYEFFIYFGRRGYVVAKVDIRGTGSSGGKLVPKEYSDVELDDGEEIIRRLAHGSWKDGRVISNGKVAMYGQSWAAFNALMLAARNTPYLTTIYALHGSEDLYYNDAHYLDGVMHKDEYILSVDHENALPRGPDLLLDSTFLEDRFSAEPWSMVYLRRQADSDFWRNNSGMYHYDRFRIPMYLVGGLYDSYSDFCLRYHDGIRDAYAARGEVGPTIKCTVGPWNHAWPQDSVIGPNYDGLGEAVRWFDRWMKGVDNGIEREREVTVYVRESHEPDAGVRWIPGNWAGVEWPVPSTKMETLHLTKDGGLETEVDTSKCRTTTTTTKDEPACSPLTLKYEATVGTEMGTWWGETLGDQATLDADSLVFDTPILTTPLTVVGFVDVSLRVSSTAKLSHWAVRLEDVHPDGKISHVTGALRNGAHRNGREDPSYLTPDEEFTISFQLHFTTWTFPAGHRLRVAVSNALFRMMWPSPYVMNSTLRVSHEDTWIRIPAVEDGERDLSLVPEFTRTQVPKEATTIPKDSRKYEKAGGFPREDVVERDGSVKTVTITTDTYFRVKETMIGAMMTQRYVADDANPARAAWLNEARQLYVFDYPEDVELINDDSVRNAGGAAANGGDHRTIMSPEFLSFHKTFPTNFPALVVPPETIPARGLGSSSSSPSSWTWIKQSPDHDASRKRWIELVTKLSIVSDEDNFYSALTRSIYENGTLIATKSFKQTDPRVFQ